MSSREIKLIKNNQNRDWEDIQWVEEFYEYLQGCIPDDMVTVKPPVKLSKDKAFQIIWYLQEILPVFPDQIEKCNTCGKLYDSYREGHYSEMKGKYYCSESCEPRGLYEREQRWEKRQAVKLKKQVGITMTRHLVMGISKVLLWDNQQLEEFFQMPGTEVRKELEQRKAAGEVYIGSQNCESFDPVKGCPGHLTKKEE